MGPGRGWWFAECAGGRPRSIAAPVLLPDAQLRKAEEFWRERVFRLLIDAHKIDEATAGSMREWQHSGFSVDTSVRIEANDQAAMSRLVGYISRPSVPFAHAHANC